MAKAKATHPQKIKINIIISKRGRDDYLNLVLHNFNLANADKKYDIACYLGEDIEDNIGKIDYSSYKSIKVQHLYVANIPEAKQADNVFCRGHIMNILLQRMRQDYDFVCVADTDMIYRHSFFDEITDILDDGTCENKCLIAKGVYTEEGTDWQKILKNKYNYDQIMQEASHRDFVTNSQIILPRAYHEKIKKFLGVASIFDTSPFGFHFIGYGAEDTLAKRIMQSSPIEVILLANAWVHLWHEPQKKTGSYENKNKAMLSPLEKVIRARLKANNYYSNRRLRKIKGFLGRGTAQ